MYERNGSNAGKYGVKYFASGAYSGFVAAGWGTMMQNGANAKNNAKRSQTPLGENANAAKNGAESDTCPLKQKTNNTQIINNKFPNDNQIGRIYDFTISDGKIILENGVQDVDFIIDMDGNLHIGSGHSYLAGGQDVQAAGTMKVNSQGYIKKYYEFVRTFSTNSIRNINYPQILQNNGLNVENSWISIYEFETNMSNYVTKTSTYYNGPVRYMPK